MKRLVVVLSVGAAALGIVLAGAFGAYGYGKDYDLHRGFTAVVALPRAGTGRLLDVQFHSTALHRRADYMVYLPPGYSPAHRYPVDYLLHGMPGQPHVFVTIANLDVRLDNLLSTHQIRPMILVFPDGRIGGSTFSDSEWANTPSGGFANYVIEVMHDVDARFATLAHRQDRVIGGFSAGAYGAMNIALHHLGDFAAVQSWSGYFIQSRTGVFATASAATLADNSPMAYVRRVAATIRRRGLRVYMFVGRDDESSVQQAPMAARLRAAGADVSTAMYAGGHDWSVWYPRLNGLLVLASEDLGRSPAPPQMAAGPGAHPGPWARRYVVAAAPATPRALVTPGPIRRAEPHRRSELWLLAALLLALVSGALINIGFVIQQRGVLRGSRPRRALPALRSRTWLAGQAIGWAGFAGQIVAVALAPLTLVQAFAAGSLALSIPLAARLLGLGVGRRQLRAIAVVALALTALALGPAPGHHHVQVGVLLAAALAGGGVVAVLARTRRGPALAVGAGVAYGIADAAIKAVGVGLRAGQINGGTPGWVLLGVMATFGGFVCFQSALQRSDAVTAISLMNAVAAVTALALGLVAFGESLGRGPVMAAVHAAAILSVLVCLRPLVRGQQAIIGTSPEPETPAADTSQAPTAALPAHPVLRVLGRVGGALLAGPAVAIACFLAVGLLYGLRSVGWPAAGPSVPDALPLLQLAGFAGQPLDRVVIACVLPGAVLGLVLWRLRPASRVVLVTLGGAAGLLLASDASFALAHNLRLSDVLDQRMPGLGPWLEALALGAGAGLPAVIRTHAASVPGAMRRARAGWHRARAAVPTRGARIARRTGLASVGLTAAGVVIALTTHGAVALVGHAPVPRRHRVPASNGQIAPALEARIGRTTGGRLTTVHFYSRALHRSADYLVYLPAGYRPTRPLPVFYLLHGMPGEPLAFTINAEIEARLEALIAQGRVRPMILVFPDGRIAGRTASDSEWADTPSGDFEDYIVDVVADVDHRFATVDTRSGRAIAGLSAGAFGAANVGLHRDDLFSLIQAWSGYFTETHNGVFAHADRAVMAYNSPLDYVRTMRRTLARFPLRIFIYGGRDDPDTAQIPAMAGALRDAGAQESWAVYPGGHSWNTWTPHVDAMLEMAGYDFDHPLGPLSGRLTRRHRGRAPASRPAGRGGPRAGRRLHGL